MKSFWLAGIAVLSAVVLSGCAESRAFHSYSEEVNSWSYPKRVGISVKDWFLDGTDIISPEVGAGESFGFDIQPTELFQIGVLFGDVMKIGYRDRGLGFYQEVHKEGGISYAYYRDLRFEPYMGTPSLFDRPRIFRGFPLRFNDEWHWCDLGVEVGVICGQIGLHVSPKEIVDFGVTTLMLPVNIVVRPPLSMMGVDLPILDYCNDDTESRVAKKYEIEMPPYPEMFQPTEVINDLVKLPY
jgi:hypothetical protein